MSNHLSGAVELVAPAKLTLSLRITGVRADGYHLLSSEMVSLDLADTLVVGPGDDLTVVSGDGEPSPAVPAGPENLVARALVAVGRRASVRLVKRIPPGAGLGGGSADAAAGAAEVRDTDRATLSTTRANCSSLVAMAPRRNEKS